MGAGFVGFAKQHAKVTPKRTRHTTRVTPAATTVRGSILSVVVTEKTAPRYALTCLFPPTTPPQVIAFKGPGIRKIVTARTREWISFEPNRQPGEPPLNLSDLWPEKTVVSSSPPLLQPESSDRISEFITPNTCFISPGSQSAEPLSGAPVFTPHAEARTVFPISPPVHTAVASSMPPPSLHVETTQAPSTLPAPYSQLQFGQPLSVPPPAPKPSLPVNTVTPPLFRLDSVPTGLEINSWPPSTSFFSQQEEDAALQQLLEPAFIDSPVPVYDSNPTIGSLSICCYPSPDLTGVPQTTIASRTLYPRTPFRSHRLASMLQLSLVRTGSSQSLVHQLHLQIFSPIGGTLGVHYHSRPRHSSDAVLRNSFAFRE
ncbi:uncharacterized protein EI90DRAFT_2456606 [Cantharellus anzutake]|uniref:uncharacterized protein n=1 Tax=Cantharellus anzutake TaxID=1750568 RepID=UPI00190648F9|nr:uncharacterized protein EI90DRAFT_2456606 [Cantharellus anzutake]KAF8339086.1 hypothetical protein EI90DRAFT_2456606 [Cantharellus anzutake]